MQYMQLWIWVGRLMRESSTLSKYLAVRKVAVKGVEKCIYVGGVCSEALDPRDSLLSAHVFPASNEAGLFRCIQHGLSGRTTD